MGVLTSDCWLEDRIIEILTSSMLKMRAATAPTPHNFNSFLKKSWFTCDDNLWGVVVKRCSRLNKKNRWLLAGREKRNIFFKEESSSFFLLMNLKKLMNKTLQGCGPWPVAQLGNRTNESIRVVFAMAQVLFAKSRGRYIFTGIRLNGSSSGGMLCIDSRNTYLWKQRSHYWEYKCQLIVLYIVSGNLQHESGCRVWSANLPVLAQLPIPLVFVTVALFLIV